MWHTRRWNRLTNQLLLLVLCISYHLHLVSCQGQNVGSAGPQHRFQPEQRPRTLRGRGQGQTPTLENDDEGTGQVIIEEPENVKNDRDGGPGRVTKESQSREFTSENIVSPWEPPLFQWIYNPALLERNAQYFEENRRKARSRNADTNVLRDLQAMRSTTEQRTLPRTRTSQSRRTNRQRHNRPLHGRRHPSRPLALSSLPHAGEQIVTKLDSDQPPSIPGSSARLPKPAVQNAFSFSSNSSPGERGRGAGPGRNSFARQRPRVSSVRSEVPGSVNSPPGRPSTFSAGQGVEPPHRGSSRRYSQPTRSATPEDLNRARSVGGHTDTASTSRADPRGQNFPTGFFDLPQSHGNPRHADEATCQARLNSCQNSEQELRRLRAVYQKNLESLKRLVAEAVDRIIQDPSEILDDGLCDVLKTRRSTVDDEDIDVSGQHQDVFTSQAPQGLRRRGGNDDDDTTGDDIRGNDSGRSGQLGGRADNVGHTRDFYPWENKPEDDLRVVDSQDIDGRRDHNLDTHDAFSHLEKQSRQQQRNSNTNVDHTQGHRAPLGGPDTQPGRDDTPQRSGGPDSRIVLRPHRTRPDQERVGSSDGVSGSYSSGTGVHFDDFEDLDEEDAEGDRTQEQVWETWRKQQQESAEQVTVAAAETRPPGCTLGEWTEWAGPVGFGVIERRRFVVGGDEKCQASTSEGDLLMRVDIAVFNANHTYYKPPEEVGQDFETDFTRSYIPRDLLLVIDASGSIEEEDFELIRDGVSVMVDLFCGGFGTGPTNNRLAIIMFASEIKIIHSFNDDQSILADVIANMTQPNGNTCTGDALKLAHDVIFTPEHGARPEVVHDTLLLTDGHSNCGEVTVQEGAQLLHSVSNVFALGVGIANDTEARWELNSVVSNNEPRHIFSLERFQDFKDMMDSIKERQKTLPCLPIVDVKPKKDVV